MYMPLLDLGRPEETPRGALYTSGEIRLAQNSWLRLGWLGVAGCF